MNEENRIIINRLEKVLKYKQLLKSSGKGDKGITHSILAVGRAISAIKSHLEPIKSRSQALKITGIGKGIADRIYKIINGELLEEEVELQNLAPELAEEEKKEEYIEDLSRVYGIGRSRAIMLTEKFKIHTVEELIEAYEEGKIKEGKNQLNHGNVVGLKYLYHIEERIPREEIDKVSQYVKHILSKINKDLRYVIAGSYLRGQPNSGDIDILISHPNLHTKTDINNMKVSNKKLGFRGTIFQLIVNVFKKLGFIVDYFTDDGDTKFMGICTIDGIHFRRLDIVFTPLESHATALMYFTGSASFNIKFRNECLSLGYTLNEDGLYEYKNKVKGKRILMKTEEELFEIIRGKGSYLTPKQRDI
jgi:DNA polymerase/3'-5' exonuclease PolX